MAEDSNKEQTTPHGLITEKHVKATLAVDKGEDAILNSWSVEDFTKKGDNYACVVSSVKLKYSLNNKTHDATYIVKLNPCRKMQSYEEFWHVLFVKELNFYMRMAPKLNAILREMGREELRVPRFLHGNLDKGCEIIFLEDLREKQFKMFDRKMGMDMAHLKLVLQELGKLHAASLFLIEKYESSQENIETIHDYLPKDWLTITDDDGQNVLSLFEQYLENAVVVLEKVTGYDRAITWVKSLKPQLKDIMAKDMKSKRRNVICHGDCWNNNILFRYDEAGHPIDVMLLDLQLCRYASPATDLNYFLYSSVEGPVRKPNLKSLLSIYYSSFKDTLEAGGSEVPYTEEEIMEEFKEQNKFGAVFAMMLVPIVLMEENDVPDMSETTDDQIQDLVESFKREVLKMVENNPKLKPRFLATFDEFMDSGLFDQE